MLSLFDEILGCDLHYLKKKKKTSKIGCIFVWLLLILRFLLLFLVVCWTDRAVRIGVYCVCPPLQYMCWLRQCRIMYILAWYIYIYNFSFFVFCWNFYFPESSYLRSLLNKFNKNIEPGRSNIIYARSINPVLEQQIDLHKNKNQTDPTTKILNEQNHKTNYPKKNIK